MADKKNNHPEFDEEGYFMTLCDEQTGEEKDFQLCARCTIDGNDYFALVAVDGNDDEYIILRGKNVDGEIFFETIDDDDEFDRVEDYMGDLLFGEVDYDEN